MKTYKIGISCIGCTVGQSVVCSCLLSGLPLETVGFGTNPFANGAYDCDSYDYTPCVYNESYLDEVIKKYHEHKLDFFIPVLDDEVFLFARNADKLKKADFNTIFSDEQMVAICRDKERMSLELNKYCNVFVNCYKKENLEDDIAAGRLKFPFIAKPRGGFGSNGIEIIKSVDELSKINDEHIIQELAIPAKDDPNYELYMKQIGENKNPQLSEISIQVVIGKNGELLGRMASFNKLNRGIPIEVVPYENEKVWEVVDKLMPVFKKMGWRGPLNIQGRMTDDGLKLFEMNPRFTGITGLRAYMGFNEVEACISHWLNIYDENIALQINKDRFGIRQFANRAVSIDRNNEVAELSSRVNGGKLKKKKVVLVTGAAGFIGQKVVNELLRDGNYKVWAFSREKSHLKVFMGSADISVFDSNDINSGQLSFGNIDIVLHLGFSRLNCSREDIADSIRFTGEVLSRATNNHVPEIINISSQGVYGKGSTPPWKEDSPVAPEDIYAEAKYSTEVMLNNLKRGNKQLKCTSLRLCAVGGGYNGMVPKDLLSVLCLAALKRGEINIVGGGGLFERLDVRDAVSAIMAVVKSDPLKWKDVYNIGSGKVYPVVDIAERIAEKVGIINNKEVLIEVNASDVNLNFGLDSSLFEKDFGWKPDYDLDDMIDAILENMLIDRVFMPYNKNLNNAI